jgi:NTP pyrophosphatase (non-canonical NTP hydrolase)
MRMMKMEKKNGKSLVELYIKQTIFQQTLMNRVDLPTDDVEMSLKHVALVTEELGEVLRADKRWKTHRNTKYNPKNKLEELADVVISTMNIAIFSGYTADDFANALDNKINKNIKRIQSKRNELQK